MKTVFILGAGASCEFGYPTGSGLVEELKDALVEQHGLYQSLTRAGHTEGEIQLLATRLRFGGFETIDELLFEWRTEHDLRQLARRTVGYHIRMLENEARLYPRPKREPHWYDLLLAHLKKHRDQISPHSFSFVTFNYDRSLRHFFYKSLSQLKGGRELADEFLADSNVLHIHGHIGPLPWQYPGDIAKPAHAIYGAHLANEDFLNFSPSIQFPDDKRDQDRRLKQLIEGADCIVFLGFGFHKSNTDALAFAPGIESKLLFATSHQLIPEGQGILAGMPYVRHIPQTVSDFLPSFLLAQSRSELTEFLVEPKIIKSKSWTPSRVLR